MSIAVHLTGAPHPALAFAEQELRRYLALAGVGGSLVYHLVVEPRQPEADSVSLSTHATGGRLAGSNPRSVLYAVYRYLEELGCRWLRPGADGEVVPRLEGPLPPVALTETAAYPYRTLCIEGACSFEHVRDLIDWGAKRRLNAYFLQFDAGTCFWRNWYQHELNPTWPPADPFGIPQAQALVARLGDELTRRGWRFEHVGHGWTSRAVGLPGESWDAATPVFSDDQRAMLAEIDGQRQLFKGVALNTNLCYGNPAVRRRLVDQVVAYAADHPGTDLVHLWLADGTNNHCECPVCAVRRPADWYVTLLNDLDAALTQAASPIRVVFLIYVDLLWPPETARLANPARFVLMFAPITRSFQSSFDEAVVPEGPLPPFTRNRLTFPKHVGVNLQFLRAWQDVFPGDAFDFDYHLTWACYYDLSQFSLAQVLARDISALGELGLHGFNSCQIQRVGFPHNLLMETLASTLWNPGIDFEDIADRWFRDAFGPVAGAGVKAFFRRYSDLWSPCFEPVYIPDRDAARIDRALANLGDIDDLLKLAGSLLDSHSPAVLPAHQLSWRYFDRFLRLQAVLLPAFRAYLQADPETPARFEALAGWLCQHEPELHPGLDVFRLLQVLQWRVNELDAWRRRQP